MIYDLFRIADWLHVALAGSVRIGDLFLTGIRVMC